MVSDLFKSSSDLYCICMILITNCHDHILEFWKFDSCSKECFIKSFIKCLCNTQTLSCGLHLRSKADICTADLLKGEYRHLDCYIICLRLKSRGISKFFDLLSDDHLRSKRYNRDSCYLTDIRNSTAGTRIYLNYIYILFAAYNKLDIDHSDYMQ